MGKILIVAPDSTRKTHLRVVLPKLIGELKEKERGEIKIIIATGLHKPHTRSELKKLVGKNIFSRYAVISHTQRKGDLSRRGRTMGGIPVVLNKNLFKADAIATIGLIEPHLYAGYSGGAKTIAIGLAGEKTINATHHPGFLDKRGAALGSVENNPFQDCLWEIVEGLPVTWSAGVVNGRKGDLRKVFIKRLNHGAADFKTEFYKRVKFAKKIFEKKLDKNYDAVICAVSAPKDINMYQASRAFNYILSQGRPIVKKGGIVLVRASLKDGFGKGIGEKRFGRLLEKIKSPEDFIKEIKRGGCLAGEHRAYMVAKAMTKAELGFIGPRAAAYTKGTGLLSFATTRSAVEYIKHVRGRDADIYFVNNALSAVLSN
ncbi:MAG: DUF2088 domain-containing protein [Candidatus Omnitrophica bacterium]|nr:DUF2088 domain-containing protein [Candidatus Omnitrophota bacterium]